MKILQIINNLGSGGAEKLIEDLVPLLNKEEGITVEVLLLTDNNNVFDKGLIDENVNIHVIPLKKVYSFLNVYYIRKYIIKGKYDIVHVHLFPSQYWTSIAMKLILKDKPKLVTTEHSTNNRRRQKEYFRYLDKIIYNSYNKIISISVKAQENLINWISPDQKYISKFKTIENGVNLNKFKSAIPYNKNELNVDFNENTKLICMVGRFTDAKDQETVMRAMQLLPEENHLILIGEGPLKEKSEDLAIHMELDNRIHFLGFRNDVDRILKTSDIIILSSYWEGLSLSSIEGMISGKPFIASDAPGLKEVVQGAGAIFPIGDYQYLSTLILELLNNKKTYNNMSIDCMNRANNYSIERTMINYIKIYNDLLARK